MSVVACIQMASGPNVGANLLEAERLIEEAVSQQARLGAEPVEISLTEEPAEEPAATPERRLQT